MTPDSVALARAVGRFETAFARLRAAAPPELQPEIEEMVVAALAYGQVMGSEGFLAGAKAAIEMKVGADPEGEARTWEEQPT